MEFLENPKFIRIFDISSTILILILTIVIAYLVITKEIINPVCEETTKETITERKEEEKGQSKETTSSQEIFVDIKGAVKTPGVYKVKEDAIINDVIRLAGGLKSNASTKYINLSKKVSNEMVITIFTSSQINQLAKQEALSMESCICSKEDISECKNSSVIETAKEESKSQINGSNKETNEGRTNELKWYRRSKSSRHYRIPY